MGNITAVLAKIKPAIAGSQDFVGDKASKSDDFVAVIAKKNVLLTIQNIKSQSPILKEMADKGKIKIVGAYYDLYAGEVIFLETRKNKSKSRILKRFGFFVR